MFAAKTILKVKNRRIICILKCAFATQLEKRETLELEKRRVVWVGWVP